VGRLYMAPKWPCVQRAIEASSMPDFCSIGWQWLSGHGLVTLYTGDVDRFGSFLRY